MKRSRIAFLWIAAVLVTVGSAAWQRRTGPTYPVRGSAALAGETIAFRLLRSQNTGEALPVRIPASSEVTGAVVWRRYPSDESWQMLPLTRAGEELVAALPSQPAAGKLEYSVRLRKGEAALDLPPAAPAARPRIAEPAASAVARFKGAVPAYVLGPHIAAMFLGMLFANAAAFSALAKREQARRQAWVAFVLLAVGGLLLGPAVQKFAFDAWWTGWPFGHDLTDNKTAVAVAAWGIALVRARGGRPARRAIVVAAIVTLAVFVIPHSLLGSELRVR